MVHHKIYNNMGTYLYEVHYNDSAMDFYNVHHFSG